MKKMRSVFAIRIFVFFVSILLCFSGCSLQPKDMRGEKKMQKSYKEYGEIFEKYGIQGITPELIKKMEKWYLEMPPEVIIDKAADLLTVLGDGEYDFENMTWTPDENGEGTGKRTVTFEWKNKQFTLEAAVEDDWFDLNVANELNEIIKKYGNGKQLYFTGDGYQECIVFYRDPEWAKSFQTETGLELVEVNK